VSAAAFPLTPLDAGRTCVLLVRAQPGARRAGRCDEWNGRLKITLSAPPEDGRANRELLEFLIDALDLRRGEIELHSGATDRNKAVRIARPFAIIEPRVRALLAARA
jgi:uncharacterized protein (TIGR00251 family)